MHSVIFMEYSYDTKESKNILISKNEVFNIPYEIKVFNDDLKNILGSGEQLTMI